MSRNYKQVILLAMMASMTHASFAQNLNTDQNAWIWENYVRTGKVIIPNTNNQQEEQTVQQEKQTVQQEKQTVQQQSTQQQGTQQQSTNDNVYLMYDENGNAQFVRNDPNGGVIISDSPYSTTTTNNSSSKSHSTTHNNSRMSRDVKAEMNAKSSAAKNPTGSSLSRARTYERNNNIKYGRGR